MCSSGCLSVAMAPQGLPRVSGRCPKTGCHQECPGQVAKCSWGADCIGLYLLPSAPTLLLCSHTCDMGLGSANHICSNFCSCDFLLLQLREVAASCFHQCLGYLGGFFALSILQHLCNPSSEQHPLHFGTPSVLSVFLTLL